MRHTPGHQSPGGNAGDARRSWRANRPPEPFTTYGTWLHGNERGSVDRKSKDIDRKYVAPDPILHEYMEERLKHPKVKLDANARRIVRETIENYCNFKSWGLHAINVRTNHVHLVVEAAEPASKMLNAIKARATRILREEKAFPPDQPIWTERGNKGRIRSERSLKRAIKYVLEDQGPDI
ncbi:MAG: transposase [Planctomycetes bacterium]|nr:transposase [Planctomycetota bacterium]